MSLKAFTQAQNASLWVHAAARVEFSNSNLLAMYHDNVMLSERLALHIADSSPGTRMIYLSSVSVYRQNQEINEEVEPEPENHYGLSKLIGERLCMAHLGQRCLVLRLAGVWGREEEPKLFVNRCLKQAQKGNPIILADPGNGRRNYPWVGDIPRIVTLAYAERWHGVLLAAGPESLSIWEMVTSIGERFGVPVQYKGNAGTRPEPDLIVKVQEKLPMTHFSEALDIEIGGRV